MGKGAVVARDDFTEVPPSPCLIYVRWHPRATHAYLPIVCTRMRTAHNIDMGHSTQTKKSHRPRGKAIRLKLRNRGNRLSPGFRVGTLVCRGKQGNCEVSNDSSFSQRF